MLISVIIPVYNVSADLFARCLASIVNQEHDDVEIIIVDDGSNEEEAILYKQICSKYSEIRYYRNSNLGPSATRNYGVQKAQGEYVLFMDADDYITDGCLSQAKTVICEKHPDIVFGYIYKDLNDEGKICYKAAKDTAEEITIDDSNGMVDLLNHILGYGNEVFDYELGYLSDGPCCRFFKRNLFSDCHFDTIPRWNEDTLWNIQLLRQCNTVVIYKSLWYIYAVRKGSAMQGYRENCFSEFLYITERVDRIGNLIWEGHIKKGIAYRVWHDIFILSRALIFHEKNRGGFIRKYEMLKQAIMSNAYRSAIRNVDFRFEKRKSRRMIKELLNCTMRTRMFLLSYGIIKLYIKTSRG